MKKSLIFITILALSLAMTGHVVHAQTATGPQPQINMTSDANGAGISVQFPQNYSGQVISTYDPKNGWQTKTVPLTQSQIDAMNQQFADQQKQIDEFFKQQQAFFDQQQKFFDSLFGNFGN